MVTPTGLEPVLPPWKGGVLTAWPRGHTIIKIGKLPSGLEPLTSSLPWKCSTYWAMEAQLNLVYIKMAPQVGFEPTTARLTAECSTTELLRNNGMPGDVLLSQEENLQLPSALRSLTSVFGMGTGVTFSLSPPDFFQDKNYYISSPSVLQHFFKSFFQRILFPEN